MILEEGIKQIRENIFDYRVDEFINDTVSLIDELSKDLKNLINEDEVKFNEIINYINISLQNKDYLLLADILKYELAPLLKKEV
ncbi:hypothetical protein OW763_04815 [Clostridium aestuarii]|uniref:Uncharacterized protein n=1 Tax=Clostridium aestuarii TaxID=338193 RepID=A0ABT4CXG6_9CLOT|nr:hypothetical protein [Clostridium aestuarii]MCY6483669.1 hypothetical protein [Clostridium aestuarii]